MQIAASPLLSCETRFKSQGASGLLWDFWKCKSQSIFADSSCEIPRRSALLNTDMEGVNLKHVNMIMHMLSVVNIKRHDTPSDFGTFASRQMTVFFLFVVDVDAPGHSGPRTAHEVPRMASICTLTFCTSQAHHRMLWEIHGGTVHQILTIKPSDVGFHSVFFPLVSVVTAALRDFPQETNQREKERIEREKGQRRVKKRLQWCVGVQYFLWRGQSLVSSSANRVLIHRSQGVNTNLYTVCVIVFRFFSIPLSVVLSAVEVGFLCLVTQM